MGAIAWMGLSVTVPCDGAEPATTGTSARQITALETLAAEVVDHNPELSFYQAEIAAAKGERRRAGTWPNPEVSTSIGQKRVRGSGLAAEGEAWAVSATQTIEWPGRIPLRKAIANHDIALAELGLAQFKSALAARTRTLAYTLFAAQEKAAAAREVAERFQQLREVLVQRDPAGVTPLLETRIIEASELTLQRQWTESALATRAAVLELNQLRGAPWIEPLEIQEPQLVFSPAPEISALLAAAQTNNFELQMRRVELQQQGLRVSLARKEGFPAFAVGPYFSQERAGDRERQVGVTLSVPLPLWNRNKGEIETAAARERQTEASLSLAERELERRVIELALAYQTKLDTMARWRPESVLEFRQAAALADRHYRLGAVPIGTYVELQKQYLEAVRALLDTRREALEAGQLLQQITGVQFQAEDRVPPSESPQPALP